MKVTIFGTGYVGLVTGTCLAEMGNQVICVDVDENKIRSLSEGKIPIYEPGLKPMVQRNCEAGRLLFTTDSKSAVMHGEVIFIAVGTPPDEDGSADLRYVLQVARTIGEHLANYAVIVNKSTVPVGTVERVREAVQESLIARERRIAFDVASNPEFLKEGDAVNDCLRPDRIIVGTSSERAVEVLHTLYAPFNRNHDRLIIMDAPSAELTKYAANAMLATKISFINEIANIAERVGADVELVRQGIGADPRIGYHFIYPGVGYGGSCFPKDVRALENIAKMHDYNADLLKAVGEVNSRQKNKLFELIKCHFGNLSGRTIALWGLAFKPNTDDMREAPSRRLMESLWREGAKVQAYDPEAQSETLRIYGKRNDLTLYNDPYAALEEADALAVVTEWKVFRSLNIERVRSLLCHPVIFDGRNLYEPEVVERQGVAYYGVGRGRSVSRSEA